MSQLTSNVALITLPSKDVILYRGETAVQSFFGFANGSTTWIVAEAGEVVEVDVDGDRVRVLNSAQH